jgi:hypothetical protein
MASATKKLSGKQSQSIAFELTPALIAFRSTAGDANRHLNTMLVALETLKTNSPVRPKGLVVPWTKCSLLAATPRRKPSHDRAHGS